MNEVVEVDDFVRSTLVPRVTGFARQHVTQRMGKNRVTGWIIETARGGEDFIPDDDIEVVHKSDEWWERQKTILGQRKGAVRLKQQAARIRRMLR